MNKAATKRKIAKFGFVEAITLHCPTCNQLCVNNADSQMIGRCDEVVYCTNCKQQYDLPVRAVKMFAVNPEVM